MNGARTGSDMPHTNVLFLPSAADESYRWLRIGNGAIAGRGEGLPAADDGASVIVVPAEDVTLHWASLPDRSPAQSVAAARVLVAEASAAPMADLHVAVGREPAGDERPIGVVSSARMQHWLAELAHAGLDPDVMIPSPMLLPRPEAGFVQADLGGQDIVRGTTTGFAHDPQLTPLVTGGVAPDKMSREAIEASIIAAIGAPSLDLRQGVFAKRQVTTLDWALRLVVIVVLPATLALVVLAGPLTVTIFHYGKFDEHDVRMSSLALTAYASALLAFSNCPTSPSAAPERAINPVLSPCARLLRKISAMNRSFSIITHLRAPRDTASSPMAPVPANASKTVASS
jgi:general secretion pathway protein L